ncbi:MAG: UDP-N-acetylglucosamine 2-epimerase (hydrolyzing), partial [Alphaproteobacteria bacterium]|nr:UDP-N-acetylglucosamine 2-epimerase (hydrolyzing) [Alphaproteobacteria bacterium]
GQAYERLKPDLVVITGDRYEMLSAASAALISRIPICHVYGGDLTEGAYDDNIRHAITKMANIHFVSNEDSRKRVIQMGEHPSSVFTVGSPALDSILHLKMLSREELQEELNIQFKKWNILITFHPETREDNTQEDLQELLNALGSLDENHCLIFTSPNADSEGILFLTKIQEFVQSKDNAYFFSTLGQKNFVSLIAQMDMVVGNSSSGLYEVPSFQIPTVNIGHRQEGRLKAASIIDSQAKMIAIIAAIDRAKHLNCASTINPYGDGKSAEKMLDVIEKINDFRALLRKKFYALSIA